MFVVTNRIGSASMSAVHSPMIRISDEQIAFFHENGFLAVEAITTQEEVARMRVAYDDIFARRAGRDEGMEFDLGGTDEDDQVAVLPQILEPRKYAEALRDTLYETNALAVSRQLLGEEAQARGSHAIFKPARYGSATPWHQDEAYWSSAHDHCSLSVWMPLQEATLENGCMQFIPGSHRLDVLPHHHIHNDPRIHGLEVDDGLVDLSTAVACPLPPGGATFHLSRTLHYTGPNRSDVPRRAFILGFGLPMKPRETPRDFYWQRRTATTAARKREAARRKAEGK